MQMGHHVLGEVLHVRMNQGQQTEPGQDDEETLARLYHGHYPHTSWLLRGVNHFALRYAPVNPTRLDVNAIHVVVIGTPVIIIGNGRIFAIVGGRPVRIAWIVIAIVLVDGDVLRSLVRFVKSGVR